MRAAVAVGRIPVVFYRRAYARGRADSSHLRFAYRAAAQAPNASAIAREPAVDGACGQRQPRWSVIRNVLHWVE